MNISKFTYERIKIIVRYEISIGSSYIKNYREFKPKARFHWKA